jgi:hypothetical protein
MKLLAIFAICLCFPHKQTSSSVIPHRRLNRHTPFHRVPKPFRRYPLREIIDIIEEQTGTGYIIRDDPHSGTDKYVIIPTGINSLTVGEILYDYIDVQLTPKAIFQSGMCFYLSWDSHLIGRGLEPAFKNKRILLPKQ